MTKRDPREAILNRLRAKGLGLAPHMVDGRVVSKASSKLPAGRGAAGAPAAVRGARGPITHEGTPRPADRHTAPGDVFEFVIDAPDKFLNANDRYGHWNDRAKRVKAWRRAGARAAAAADLPTGVPRLQVDCYVIKPIQNNYDPANWAPTAKAVLDGMVSDYGLAEDDNRRFVTGPFMHEGGPGDDALRVRVTVLASSS